MLNEDAVATALGLAPLDLIGQPQETDLLVMRGLLPSSAAYRLTHPTD